MYVRRLPMLSGVELLKVCTNACLGHSALQENQNYHFPNVRPMLLCRLAFKSFRQNNHDTIKQGTFLGSTIFLGRPGRTRSCPKHVPRGAISLHGLPCVCRGRVNPLAVACTVLTKMQCLIFEWHRQNLHPLRTTFP